MVDGSVVIATHSRAAWPMRHPRVFTSGRCRSQGSERARELSDGLVVRLTPHTRTGDWFAWGNGSNLPSWKRNPRAYGRIIHPPCWKRERRGRFDLLADQAREPVPEHIPRRLSAHRGRLIVEEDCRIVTAGVEAEDPDRRPGRTPRERGNRRSKRARSPGPRPRQRGIRRRERWVSRRSPEWPRGADPDGPLPSVPTRGTNGRRPLPAEPSTRCGRGRRHRSSSGSDRG